MLTGATGPAFDNALGSGIRAIAKLYKAMAFGYLIQLFEDVPIEISLAGSIPRERAEVMDTILALLESARQVQAFPASEVRDRSETAPEHWSEAAPEHC